MVWQQGSREKSIEFADFAPAARFGTTLESTGDMNAKVSAPRISMVPSRAPARPAPARSPVEAGLGEHYFDLRRRACQLTRDSARADDLVQDTVERALRFKHTFREGGHLRAWLMRIMQNVFISNRRRVAAERRVLDGARVDPNGWARMSPAQMAPWLSPPVERALGDMPEHLRAVVELVDLADHSYKDAAAQQDVPVGTIMSRLHRGRARLASQLDGPLAA